MNTDCRSCASTARRALAVRWLSTFLLVLFIGQVGFTQYHLLTEVHFDGGYELASPTKAVVQESEDGDHHDTDHHHPHAAADHQTQMRAFETVSLPVIDLIVSDIQFSVIPPASFSYRVTLEKERAPGESPPDPLQPRAPPLV